MKNIFLRTFTLLALINIAVLQGQTLILKQHKVNRGETVTNIAKQYNVSVNDIYKYNPEIKNGIKENSFLLIPNIIDNKPKDAFYLSKTDAPTKEQISVEKAVNKTHLVKKNETLYGISKKYNVPVEKLLKLNSSLNNIKLKIGQSIVISNSTEIKATTEIQSDGDILAKSVIVKPEETIYGLALENKTTVKILYMLNPKLEKEGLQIGQKIYVPYSEDIKELLDIIYANKTNSESYEIITIKENQTLYSLGKKYNVTAEQLIKLNPKLKKGLKKGMNLIVPNIGGSGNMNITQQN